MTVLNDLKTQLELVGVSIIDTKLIALANNYLSILSLNSVPVCLINEATEADEFTEINDAKAYWLMLTYLTDSILIDLNADLISHTTWTILESRKNYNLQALVVKFRK